MLFFSPLPSGQFQFISHSGGDSDSDNNSSDGAEFVTMPSCHPTGSRTLAALVAFFFCNI